VDSILTYCRYNLMIDDIQLRAHPLRQTERHRIINASPLHMGIITERGAPDWHPAPQSVRDAGQRIVALCRARGLDASEVALRFCLDNPPSPAPWSACPRASTSKALKCLELANDLALLEEIRATVAPVATSPGLRPPRKLRLIAAAVVILA